jgi:hypothetical protein
MNRTFGSLSSGVGVFLLLTASARAGVFNFSTGSPDGLIATASRPASTGKIETESADDFVLTQQTQLHSASFTWLVTNTGTGSFSFPRVTVDIYRVFPNESDATRTITVPTRVNSPGDVELTGADTNDGNLSFTTTTLNPSFTANNSILNGIHGSPDQTTGGEGPVTGAEVQFNVTFTPPINLSPDHYFFRPEVQVENGEFYWLSAAKPIVAPGTDFSPDLQSWTRNETILPDWVRIGTDVIGGETPPTFNASFSLVGETAQAIPLPPAVFSALASAGFAGVLKSKRVLARRFRRD